MAKPAPCQRCLEVPDADYYLTNRLEAPWLFDQSTVALCFSCLVQITIQMAEAYQAAVAALEAEQAPGVLEAIETDEGAVPPAKGATKSRQRKAPTEQAVVVPAAWPEEGETTDDHR